MCLNKKADLIIRYITDQYSKILPPKTNTHVHQENPKNQRFRQKKLFFQKILLLLKKQFTFVLPKQFFMKFKVLFLFALATLFASYITNAQPGIITTIAGNGIAGESGDGGPRLLGQNCMVQLILL